MHVQGGDCMHHEDQAVFGARAGRAPAAHANRSQRQRVTHLLDTRNVQRKESGDGFFVG